MYSFVLSRCFDSSETNQPLSHWNEWCRADRHHRVQKKMQSISWVRAPWQVYHGMQLIYLSWFKYSSEAMDTKNKVWYPFFSSSLSSFSFFLFIKNDEQSIVQSSKTWRQFHIGYYTWTAFRVYRKESASSFFLYSTGATTADSKGVHTISENKRKNDPGLAFRRTKWLRRSTLVLLLLTVCMDPMDWPSRRNLVKMRKARVRYFWPNFGQRALLHGRRTEPDKNQMI